MVTRRHTPMHHPLVSPPSPARRQVPNLSQHHRQQPQDRDHLHDHPMEEAQRPGQTRRTHLPRLPERTLHPGRPHHPHRGGRRPLGPPQPPGIGDRCHGRKTRRGRVYRTVVPTLQEGLTAAPWLPTPTGGGCRLVSDRRSDTVHRSLACARDGPQVVMTRVYAAPMRRGANDKARRPEGLTADEARGREGLPSLPRDKVETKVRKPNRRKG